MKEEWRPVVGYEGLYEVSDLGRIRSLDRDVPLWEGTKRIKGVILSINKATKYPSVSLCKNRVRTAFLVHRIVAISFVPNPKDKPCVNHIDCNKENNRVDNLEWVTYSENSRHSHENKRWVSTQKHKDAVREACRKTGLKSRKISDKDIVDIRKRFKPWCDKDGGARIAKDYGVSQGTIYAITNRRGFYSERY